MPLVINISKIITYFVTSFTTLMAAFTASLAYLIAKSEQSGHFLEGLNPEAVGLLALGAMLTITNPTIQIFHYLFVPKRKHHINAAQFLKDIDQTETSEDIDARLKQTET